MKFAKSTNLVGIVSKKKENFVTPLRYISRKMYRSGYCQWQKDADGNMNWTNLESHPKLNRKVNFQCLNRGGSRIFGKVRFADFILFFT